MKITLIIIIVRNEIVLYIKMAIKNKVKVIIFIIAFITQDMIFQIVIIPLKFNFVMTGG